MTSERGTNSERLVGALEAVWSSTAALCRDLTDEEWALPTRCPGWSVQDLIAHMLGTEAMLAGRSQPAVDVPDAPHLRNDIGRFNEAWIIERRSRRGADVLDEFVEITRDRLAALGRMDQAQFDEEAWTPAGKATYGRFMQIRVFDCWMHEQDARAALDRPGHLTGPAADVSLDEIAQALGYAVGKRAGAPAGTSVALVVTGPTRHRFDVVVTDRARLSATATLAPTTTVTTDLATFVALVGGRIDPVAPLDGGLVTVSGDAELGRAVATHLAFVI